MALSTSVAARCANQLMSAVSYRISAIVFNSGVKYQDINCLHKLAVCMSPDMVVNMQKKMGESCDRKLLVWKREIDENKSAKMLLKEIHAKQVTGAAVERSQPSRSTRFLTKMFMNIVKISFLVLKKIHQISKKTI